jgi:hypothetical protein
MKNFLKGFFERRKKQELLIKSELERKKINFVYRFLLNQYEFELRGKVDLPAFEYATKDMKHIIKTNQIEKAYQEANRVLKEGFEKGKSAI